MNHNSPDKNKDSPPTAQAGDNIRCPHCRSLHSLREKSGMLFFWCKYDFYMAGMNGKLTMSPEALVRKGPEAVHTAKHPEEDDDGET